MNKIEKVSAFLLENWFKILIIASICIIGVIKFIPNQLLAPESSADVQTGGTDDSTSIDEVESEQETETTSQEEKVIQEIKEAETEKNIIVEIKGGIEKPGVYELSPDSRVIDLIEKAGGFTSANSDCINQAAKLNDADLIIVPLKGEKCNENREQTSIHPEETQQKINLNTATHEELQQLSGIGQAKANAIITYREETGEFKSIDELQNVAGIGESLFTQLKDKITI